MRFWRLQHGEECPPNVMREIMRAKGECALYCFEITEFTPQQCVAQNDVAVLHSLVTKKYNALVMNPCFSMRDIEDEIARKGCCPLPTEPEDCLKILVTRVTCLTRHR